MRRKGIQNVIVCLVMIAMCMGLIEPCQLKAESVYVDRCADVVFVIDGTGSM